MKVKSHFGHSAVHSLGGISLANMMRPRWSALPVATFHALAPQGAALVGGLFINQELGEI